MPRREELPVQEEEQFPIGRARGAPSDDIGWHFGDIVQGAVRNTIQCKLCDKVITGSTFVRSDSDSLSDFTFKLQIRSLY
ncbi:hypothetical protein P8452_23190 [Trifolium repens]|nr:hypothetical protein P8452_23190 [Trifolium repens]